MCRAVGESQTADGRDPNLIRAARNPDTTDVYGAGGLATALPGFTRLRWVNMGGLNECQIAGFGIDFPRRL